MGRLIARESQESLLVAAETSALIAAGGLIPSPGRTFDLIKIEQEKLQVESAFCSAC